MFRGGRYSPRFSGAGKQFLEQAVNKNLIKVLLTPALKAKIREKFNCTNEDIDKAIQAGITDFGDDFKKLLAEQRAMLTPPKRDKEPPTGSPFFDGVRELDKILDDTNESEKTNDPTATRQR